MWKPLKLFGVSTVPGLVNLQKTNWKDPPFYSWVNPLFLWPFSITMLVYQRVNSPIWFPTDFHCFQRGWNYQPDIIIICCLSLYIYIEYIYIYGFSLIYCIDYIDIDRMRLTIPPLTSICRHDHQPAMTPKLQISWICQVFLEAPVKKWGLINYRFYFFNWLDIWTTKISHSRGAITAISGQLVDSSTSSGRPALTSS